MACNGHHVTYDGPTDLPMCIAYWSADRLRDLPSLQFQKENSMGQNSLFFNYNECFLPKLNDVPIWNCSETSLTAATNCSKTPRLSLVVAKPSR